MPLITPLPTLLTLPDELIADIAASLLLSHEGRVIEASALATFSSTSKKIRALTIAPLFKDVPLSSENQLSSLAHVSEDLLQLVKVLSIYLDANFLETWRRAGDAENDDNTAPGIPYPPIFLPFCAILLKTSHLRSLNLRVAENTGPRSAWRKFSMTRSAGLSFGLSFTAALASPLLSFSPETSPILQKLTSLHIDGFQDLGPLLALCPNLEELHVCNSGGFDHEVSTQLVRDLKIVPAVKRLSFTPEILRLNESESESSAELVRAIGLALPQLERLALQTRWFGYGIYFFSGHVNPHDLLEAVSHFPHLTHLYLPVSLLAPDELENFRLPRDPALPNSADVRAEARRLALRRVEEQEVEVISRMRSVSPLKVVAWVRYNSPDDRRESSVEYEIPRWGGVKETGALTSTVHAGEDGMTDPWPLVALAAYNVSLVSRSRVWSWSNMGSLIVPANRTQERIYWAGIVLLLVAILVNTDDTWGRVASNIHVI